jgi:hypothetical protein
MKVVSGYKTRELYITSFVENKEVLAIIMSFFGKNIGYNLVYNKKTFKTCYITIKLDIQQV